VSPEAVPAPPPDAAKGACHRVRQGYIAATVCGRAAHAMWTKPLRPLDALDARIGDAQTLAPTEELGKVQFLPTSWRGLL